MSRRRLKGDLDLAILTIVLFFGLSLLMVTQIQVIKDLTISKETVSLNMNHDDRGTEIVSLLRSGENDMVTMYVLGTLATDNHDKYVKDYVQKIEERVSSMNINHELMVFGKSLSYFSGSTIKSSTPAYGQASARECGSTLPLGTNIELKWPTPVNRISSGFGSREVGGECKCHGGIDIGDRKEGHPVYPAAKGRVVEFYGKCKSGDKTCPPMKGKEGIGNYVKINHEFNGKTYQTVYFHLKEVNDDVKVGLEVDTGKEIGKIGNTGESTGPHLHFELRGELFRPDKDSINLCGLFETRDWIGDCVHEIPDACRTFNVYSAQIPVPGAQSGNVKTGVSLRIW